MSNARWISSALDVPDQWKLVVGGTWLAGETITLTVNGKDIVLTVGATVTTASIATAIQQAWNGDAITGDATRSETGDNVPEFAEYAATIGATTSTVLFTAATKGVPGTLAATTTSVSGTLTLTHPTAGTGASDWSNTDNWDGGALPADGDAVFFDHSGASARYGLAQSAVQPASMRVAMSYTGDIGLPEVSDGGYHEYRKTYLELGPVALEVGAGEGNGSGRIKINSGTDPCALTVLNTGSSADDLPAFLWKGTNAGNTLTMRGGSVGVAVFGGETATLATVTVDGGDLTLGSGVTLSGAIVVNDGTLRVNSAIAGSLVVTGGVVIIEGTGAVAQLTVRGAGTVIYNTTGTLGGATKVSGSGVLDFSQGAGVTQVTNPIDLYGAECRVLDPNSRVWDGATARKLVVDYNEGAGVAQVDMGLDFRLARTATA